MEEEFDLVTDNLNNNIIEINKILFNICNTSEEINQLIANYYKNILELEIGEPYELKFPYIGMKEEIIYRAKVINNLGELLKSLSKIKYFNKELNEIYLTLLNHERKYYITYGKVFFEPIAWNEWQNFANERLTLRKELIYTVILAIRLLQDEYSEEALDEFHELDIIDENKKYEILDFMAEYHIEQRYIKDYFINNTIDNFIEVIYNR